MPEMRVSAVVMRQRGRELFMFSLRSDVLRNICWVLPRSKDNPGEIQRKLDKAKLQNIGEFLRKENSYLPNSLVLNLTIAVRFEPGPDGRSGFLVFPSDGSENKGKPIVDRENKYGYLLDGQHRLVGFDYAPGIVFDLPITAFLGADQSLGKKVFTDINSTQSKVSPILLQAIQYEIGELEPEKLAAVTVAKRLNEQTDSPLCGMVKFEVDERGKISSVTLASYIRPIMSLDGPLYEKNENQRVQILRNYFMAFKELFPAAWGSKTHVITKNIGLHVMCGIFRRIYQRCERYEGGSTDVDAFKRQLGPLISVVEFDWRSEKFGVMSGKKGMEMLRRAVLRTIPVESDTEPDLQVLRELSQGGGSVSQQQISEDLENE